MAGRTRYNWIVCDSARWDGFELRSDDIIISTPAKCGTTWTQMICALLILQEPELPLPLDTLSPWIDMVTRARTDVFADLEAQTHRRFIKTHTPLDGIPNDPTVTYICVGRDPRDVALSMDHHIDNTDIGAFLMQVSVQGAWGIIPVHLNELSPPEIRATFPGFVYQLGNLIASRNLPIQVTIAEAYGNNYGLAMASVVGTVVVIIVLLVLWGPERHGVAMADAQRQPATA